jgi:hypothetical protein
MEPENATPNLGSEQAPIEYGLGIERAFQTTNPEQGIETGAERKEQTGEARAVSADATTMTSPILPAPVAVDDVPITTAIGVASPIIANDDDLIEKEWVDKAKKIVADTQNDPYQREAAVNQLQRDYLKKRYGRELGEA